MIEYYSIRRLNPYLGSIQVIDAGAVRAYSTDGQCWQARRVYDAERFWAENGVGEEARYFAEVSKKTLLNAVNQRPGLPFPRGDKFELWLLNKRTRMPLALLKTCRWEHDCAEVSDPAWRPFSPGEKGFNERRAGGANPGATTKRLVIDQQRIATLVNYAAKPLPAAQWFERSEDGSGTGIHGLRISPEIDGRHLRPHEFPELLVDERWGSDEEEELVRAYHDWNAPRLLTHHGLSRGTRYRLEQSACRFPRGLLDAYAVLPEQIDQDALRVAVVTEKLIRSA